MTTSVNFKMDAKLKSEFSDLLKNLGLDMTTAFNIFARAVVRERGIPFELKENIADKHLNHTKDENELREILAARIKEIEEGKGKFYTMSEMEAKMAEKGWEW